jgi:uncharacterized protein (DUF885 family)
VPSAVHQLCDAYMERLAALDPVTATSRGLLGHDDELTDYSPEGVGARSELDRKTLGELVSLPVTDGDDRVAAAFLAEWLRSRQALDEAGESLRTLRIISSPFQLVRQVFDLMPREEEEDWVTIATRLEKVPASLGGLRASLEAGVGRGLPPARRQVLACAAQGAAWAGLSGARPFFAALVARYRGADAVLRHRLESASESATAAYATMSEWLRGVLAPISSERDAVGPDRYALAARQHLGGSIDLLETYAWGWEELHRIEGELAQTAALILPGGDVLETIELLETDPARALHGEEALQRFLQELIDRTIAELDGVHFEIPAPLHRVEAMIAPPGGAAAQYYTGPAEDFSQPGRTWYPTLGKTVFPRWGEVSTCYHEAVPGHHLQVGQIRCLKDRLSRFQRHVFNTAHGEGWALYAERLMDELGYFAEPEYRLGFLASQLLRALRVVVDIGVHLELTIPAGDPFHPGERWTPELALDFLLTRGHRPGEFLRSELDRYLGWPGQAICYKVGERAWLEARAEARRQQAEDFDLKRFHTRALALGPLTLGQLATEVAAPASSM